MGSNQSSTTTRPESSSGANNVVSNNSDPANKTNRDADKPQTKLTGFALVQKQCRKHKRKYDKCYASWYSGSFVSGKDVNSRQESCDDLFDEWRECILLGMNRDRKERGLGPPSEDSILGEVADEE